MMELEHLGVRVVRHLSVRVVSGGQTTNPKEGNRESEKAAQQGEIWKVEE
jgi:hypothetical protein